MSLKYSHKDNIYYGKLTARTSVWLTLWPKVLPKPGNSYNWNCGFIFFSQDLWFFPFFYEAFFLSKLQQLTFAFLNLPWQNSKRFQLLHQSTTVEKKAWQEPWRGRKGIQKTTPGISRSLCNWNAHWQALDLSLFWLPRQFLFCTQSCVKTWGIEHVPPPSKKI